MAVFANGGVAADGNVRHQFCAIADGHVAIDNAVWPDADIFAELYRRCDNCRGVNEIGHGVAAFCACAAFAKTSIAAAAPILNK